MDLEEDPEGDIELKGIRFRKMPRSIVDTGYGLEKIVFPITSTENKKFTLKPFKMPTSLSAMPYLKLILAI